MITNHTATFWVWIGPYCCLYHLEQPSIEPPTTQYPGVIAPSRRASFSSCPWQRALLSSCFRHHWRHVLQSDDETSLPNGFAAGGGRTRPYSTSCQHGPPRLSRQALPPPHPRLFISKSTFRVQAIWPRLWLSLLSWEQRSNFCFQCLYHLLRQVRATAQTSHVLAHRYLPYYQACLPRQLMVFEQVQVALALLTLVGNFCEPAPLCPPHCHHSTQNYLVFRFIFCAWRADLPSLLQAFVFDLTLSHFQL